MSRSCRAQQKTIQSPRHVEPAPQNKTTPSYPTFPTDVRGCFFFGCLPTIPLFRSPFPQPVCPPSFRKGVLVAEPAQHPSPGSPEVGREPFGVDNPRPHQETLVPNRLFPYLPPVELDAGRFEAVVGVVVDELRVDRRVPHHLQTSPAQTASRLRKKKNQPKPKTPLPFPTPHLCPEQPTGIRG